LAINQKIAVYAGSVCCAYYHPLERLRFHTNRPLSHLIAVLTILTYIFDRFALEKALQLLKKLS